jgi:hypothetical protein
VPKAPVSAHFLKGRLHVFGHMPVSQPWRIPHDDVNPVFRSRKPDWASKIADEVAPDVVATFFVQAAHRLKG